ncbi:MAG: hypothetical protein GXP53_11875 [Deltaproteobacteria bacterium]|nr:hypothetical protein [Deltaproteobacteria bacterium]
MKTGITIKTILAALFIASTLIYGCNGKNEATHSGAATVKNNPGLAGTWLQTMAGKQDISKAGAHVIITRDTLTMDAPGCRISGHYTISGNRLDFVITSLDGPRCAKGEKQGGGGSVTYTVKDDTMTWEIPGQGPEGIKIFKRITEGPPAPSSTEPSTHNPFQE